MIFLYNYDRLHNIATGCSDSQGNDGLLLRKYQTGTGTDLSETEWSMSFCMSSTAVIRRQERLGY